MPFPLDVNDWKILNQLDMNSRQSNSKIGRNCRLSKQVVNYRINRLVENRVITSFFPHINLSKLGYSVHKVYIQLKSVSKEKEEELWEFLISQPAIIWTVSCSGRWDIIFAIASTSIEIFNDVLADFMNRYSRFVSSRAISVFNKATLHHRKWLFAQKQDTVYWLLGGRVEDVKIDSIDQKILYIINKNAREPVIVIAKKAGISSSRVIQRIKRLRQKGIIGAFRIGLNRKGLGINYCKAFIYYTGQTSEHENRLLAYCRSLSNIIGVSQSIGPWNLELEFEVRDYDEFHDILKEIRNRFPIVANFETVYIERESGFSFLPGALQ